MPPKQQKIRSWQFQNGITFEISYPRQPPPIATLAHVFSQYLEFLQEHHKQHEMYTEAELPVAYAAEGRKFYANCHLFYLGGDLPTQAWIQAVITASIAADTAMQIIEDVEGWREKADTWLLEAVNALQKPDGDLDCFEILLKRANQNLLR